MQRGRLFTAATVAVLVGCSGSDPAGPHGMCIGVVQVNGLAYVLDGSKTPVAPSAVSQNVFAEVKRNIGCDDLVLSPGDGFEDVDEDGESNFLPVGTTLHAIDGRSTSAALAVMWDGEWQVLTHIGAP